MLFDDVIAAQPGGSRASCGAATRCRPNPAGAGSSRGSGVVHTCKATMSPIAPSWILATFPASRRRTDNRARRRRSGSSSSPARKSSITFLTLGTSTPTGFSQKTCLLAASAAPSCNGRKCGGVARMTTSHASMTALYASMPENWRSFGTSICSPYSSVSPLDARLDLVGKEVAHRVELVGRGRLHRVGRRTRPAAAATDQAVLQRIGPRRIDRGRHRPGGRGCRDGRRCRHLQDVTPRRSHRGDDRGDSGRAAGSVAGLMSAYRSIAYSFSPLMNDRELPSRILSRSAVPISNAEMARKRT